MEAGATRETQSPWGTSHEAGREGEKQPSFSLLPAFQVLPVPSISQTHWNLGNSLQGSTHPATLSVLSCCNISREGKRKGWIMGKQAWEQQETTDWLYTPPSTLPPPTYLDLTGSICKKCFYPNSTRKRVVSRMVGVELQPASLTSYLQVLSRFYLVLSFRLPLHAPFCPPSTPPPPQHTHTQSPTKIGHFAFWQHVTHLLDPRTM